MVHLTEQICSTRIIYRPFSAPGHQTPYERARSPLRPIEAPARPCYRAHIFHRQDAPMIPRYSRPQMASIWEPEAKFRIWFEIRSEEHTSELQSLMRISYAVFCLKKKILIKNYINQK